MNTRLSLWWNRVTNDLAPIARFLISIVTLPWVLCTLPFRKSEQNHEELGTADSLTIGSRISGSLRSYSELLGKRSLIMGLSLIALAVVAWFAVHTWHRNSAAYSTKLSNKADLAFEAGNLSQARTLYEEANSDELTNQQKLNRTIALFEANEQELAREELCKLAPDRDAGFGPAHKLRAWQLATLLNTDPNAIRKCPDLLGQLRWHLTNGDDATKETDFAWALYHHSLDEIDQAVEKLSRNARDAPEHQVMIARLQNEAGNKLAESMAWESAEEKFRSQLNEAPENLASQLNLAEALIALNKDSEAEESLQACLRLSPGRAAQKQIANLYVKRYERSIDSGDANETASSYLIEAIQIDHNSTKAIAHLTKCYFNPAATEKLKSRIQETLEGLVQNDKPSGVVHLVLGNMLAANNAWEPSIKQFELALKFEPNRVEIQNNLAWCLTQTEKPDLKRALELASSASKLAPNNSEVRETHGTVLLLLRQHKQAITELTTALMVASDSSAANQARVHGKLAEAFQELGMNELAAKHASKSN